MSRHFEDLPVWKSGRELVRRVYAFTRLPAVARDYGFCDQIQRAAISVTNNIAEGHERGTTVELVVFLFYAKGSAGEVRSMCWNAEDIGYLPAPEAGELRELAAGIGRQLHAWIESMQTPDFDPGPKYRQNPPAGVKRWEAYLEQRGLIRLENGQYVMTERKDGKTEERK
ncbi:MAG: four helix bundle protein [Kiritimatiellia bacterium]